MNELILGVAGVTASGGAAVAYARVRSGRRSHDRNRPIELAPVVEKAHGVHPGLGRRGSVPAVPAGTPTSHVQPAPVASLAPPVAAAPVRAHRPPAAPAAPAASVATPSGSFATELVTVDGRITMRDPDDDGSFSWNTAVTDAADSVGIDVGQLRAGSDSLISVGPDGDSDAPIRWRSGPE